MLWRPVPARSWHSFPATRGRTSAPLPCSRALCTLVLAFSTSPQWRTSLRIAVPSEDRLRHDFGRDGRQQTFRNRGWSQHHARPDLDRDGEHHHWLGRRRLQLQQLLPVWRPRRGDRPDPCGEPRGDTGPPPEVFLVNVAPCCPSVRRGSLAGPFSALFENTSCRQRLQTRPSPRKSSSERRAALPVRLCLPHGACRIARTPKSICQRPF
mmetsp:Transcript_114230/g.369422  ORF Transcript_114230/g.369422 Transcript_114230/m.369422 type:complete len:210 (+) Transcript_114230:1619-2248(+)